MITGQAVETFDIQFQSLYLVSRGVSLNKVQMAEEPVPDPLPQPAPAPVSAAVARKLINPKYALVATGTHTSPTSSDQNSSNKNSNSQNPTGLKMPKGRLKGVIEEAPIHPGLLNLEKAYLIPYLPTWPEPDPPSDVIGFINIRDDKRSNQVHLQRSERFEVSQAIRFSAPLTVPAKAEEQASNQDAKDAQTAGNPPVNTTPKTSVPTTPTDKTLKQDKDPNKDQTESTESSQEPSTSPTQDTPKPHEDTSAPASEVTADTQPTDSVTQTPKTQPTAPPVPKRRTLQLVIDPSSSQQPGEAQVTLTKMDQLDSLSKEPKRPPLTPTRSRMLSVGHDRDSGSNEEGSQDSTKVICDPMVTEEPSSASAGSEEEFYDCSPQEPSNPVVNGGQTGSGRGQRLGDGLNMMARFSQSMLDLREPNHAEDSISLIILSQQLRRQSHESPPKHTRQVSY